jgi:hypothetical protein
MSRSRFWLVALLLVTVGWLVSPAPVPIYDGVGVPDEPYRLVEPPAGATATAEPTVATGVTPLKDGRSVRGLVLSTLEQSPQFSLYVPPAAMASKGREITVRAQPVAPTDPPPGKVIGSNVYRVTFTDPAGPVTVTASLGSASMYLRALDTSDGWSLQFRAKPTDPWLQKETARSGTDTFVGSFAGPGDYALAKVPTTEGAGGGISVLPLVLGGALLLLVVIIIVVRLRAAPE